jgi:GNAT superfamily N-acetyltransferase
MQLIEVNSPQTTQAFIRLPVDLYKNDPNFVRPLDKDIEDVFNPKKNKLLRKGTCIRWILLDDRAQVIGRVAAFVNPQTARTFTQPTGGIGFFECINDQQAAFQLFDAAKQWLQAQGMEAMDGPINLGDRDKWWGLLVEEFSPATYGTNYNFPYYQQLFEAYGFQVYFKQYTYLRKVLDPLEGRYAQRAEEALKNPDYSFRHLEKSKMAQYAEDFRVVYNKAWVKHQGVKEMSSAQAQNIMLKMKPVMDEKILWFAYYKTEPVGFFIAIPELNQLFRYVNGKLDLWGKIKFLYYKWRGKVNRATGIAFGITPEHQRKGVEAAMILAAGNQVYFANKTPYDDFVMNWIGDFNPKMMRVCEQIGAKIYKTHHTYRKLFDETQEFKRAPII